MSFNDTSGIRLIDMSLGLLPAEESYMIGNDDYMQNLDKWKPGKNNILYVTGLSGSGKSTLAEEYEKKYNAHMFELDGIQHNYDSSGKGILEKVKKKFPQYNTALNTWLKNNNGEINNEQYKLLKNISDYVISLCKEDSQILYIIEGVQLFQWYDPETFNSKPIIIKGTSMMTSAIRGLLRDHKNNNSSIDLKMLARSFPKRFKWLNEDEKKLGKFKRGLESVISDEYRLIKTSNSYYFKNSDGMIVSKLKYHDYSNGKIKNFNWVLISDVDTNQDFRRKGLASNLINQLYKDITSSNSKKGLYLMVKSDNTNAISVYTKLGFNTLKKQKGSNSSYNIMYKGNGNLDRLSNMNFATD